MIRDGAASPRGPRIYHVIRPGVYPAEAREDGKIAATEETLAQLIGVVLAGGGGRSAGRARVPLPEDGPPLEERAARTLRSLCSGVVVAIDAGEVNRAPRFPVVQIVGPSNRGPLAAVLAAMDATGSADLLVLDPGYPGVEPGLFRTILDSARPGVDVVFPYDANGRDHPLVGLWKRSAARAVREALERGVYKVRSILPDMVVQRLGPDDFVGIDVAVALRSVREVDTF